MQADSSKRSEFACRIVQWQQAFGRHHLPWQNTRDAYRIWVSEVMLQQTQVSTVLRFYPPFIERFPSLAQLAIATLDEVLALWSGLGYYRRARFLHACAQQVMRDYGGEFPADEKLLAKLPGIGRSTAGAIAAFAFHRRAAILDGNVKRVLARVFALALDQQSSKSSAIFWSLAESLLPGSEAMPAYTQGLMDLGATRCLVHQPLCKACPLQDICEARKAGSQHDYPLPKATKTLPLRQWMMLWISDGQRILLVRRPAKGIWASMWSLPEVHELAAYALGPDSGVNAITELAAAKPSMQQCMHQYWQRACEHLLQTNDFSAFIQALLRASALEDAQFDYSFDIEQSFTHFRLRAPVLCIRLGSTDSVFGSSHHAFEPVIGRGVYCSSMETQSGLWLRFEDALAMGIPNALRKRLQAALSGDLKGYAAAKTLPAVLNNRRAK